MIITGRALLFGLALLIVLAGTVLLVIDASARLLAGAIVLPGLAMTGVLWWVRAPTPPRQVEPDDIRAVSDQRCRELIRGTSLFLREMRYRFSVRYDRTDRERFTAEVNAVRVGFVPAVISDQLSDRQGFGYVAFVYDERRWRGPGLPCGGGPQQAVEYATRCISPLDDEASSDRAHTDDKTDDGDDGENGQPTGVR